MTGVLKLRIAETAEELKVLLDQQTTVTGWERVQALYLLKKGEVSTITGVAEILGRDISTVFRWFQRYRAKGLEGLLNIQRNQGRKPVIPPEVRQVLQERLQDPEAFESYTDVKAWLEQEHGIVASYKVVHETVRYRLNIRLKSCRSRSQPSPSAATHA